MGSREVVNESGLVRAASDSLLSAFCFISVVSIGPTKITGLCSAESAGMLSFKINLLKSSTVMQYLSYLFVL